MSRAKLSGPSSSSQGGFIGASTAADNTYKGARNINLLKARAVPRTPRALTEPVEVPVSAFARVPTGMTPDGLLLRSMQGRDMAVGVPVQNVMFAGDVLTLRWDASDLVPTHTITQADLVAGVPIPMVIPQALLAQEGAHTLNYTVAGITDTLTGIPRPIVIDLTAPGDPLLGRIKFDDAIETGGLTSEQLTDLGDVLTGAVPGYTGIAWGDHIFAAAGSFPTDMVEVTEALGGVSIEVDFPRHTLEAAGDGRIEFRYQVEDRAGNTTWLSDPTYINLLLAGAIDDFLAPLVPANDDGLITDADARVPVVVQIPGHASVRQGDTVVVLWGSRRQAPIAVGAGDVGQDPLLEIAVPFSELLAEGNGSIDVSYEAFRGGMLLGRSPATTVEVDLTLPGGPDPDPTTPELEDLEAPTVTSFSGEENYIPPQDSTEDATATIEWYNLATPPVEVFLAGDDLLVKWGTTELTQAYTITAADAVAKVAIEITVPAAVVGAASGTFPVSYTITRALSGGGGEHSNTALSPSRDVVVESAGDLPGGGLPLPLGEFTERNANNALGWCAIRDNTPFRVPLYINKKIGDTIVIAFQGYDGLDGSGGPITGATHTASHIVGADDLATYYDFTLPVGPLRLVRYGQGRCKYSVTPPGSTSPVNGDDQTVRMDTRAQDQTEPDPCAAAGSAAWDPAMLESGPR